MSNNDCKNNEFQNNVSMALKAFADTVTGNNAGGLEAMYNITIDQLSSKEGAAYKEGVLAMTADMGRLPFKSYRHRKEFRKAFHDK